MHYVYILSVQRVKLQSSNVVFFSVEMDDRSTSTSDTAVGAGKRKQHGETLWWWSMSCWWWIRWKCRNTQEKREGNGGGEGENSNNNTERLQRTAASPDRLSGGATPGRARSNDLAGRSTALAPPCLLLCFASVMLWTEKALCVLFWPWNNLSGVGGLCVLRTSTAIWQLYSGE